MAQLTRIVHEAEEFEEMINGEVITSQRIIEKIIPLTDEEAAALIAEKQPAIDLDNARIATETAKQADLAEMRGNKFTAARDLLQGDLDTINAASPVTNAMIVKAVKDMLFVQIAAIKILNRLLN